MKFALFNNEKIEATKGENGFCPSCGSEVIAKCGEIKVHHWAHKGNRNCDPWWENETQWHRVWKNNFPAEWQEVVNHADDGERHIADVKTPSGWVLEFQHSLLKSEERRSRDAFYSKLIWIVDGTRRKTDAPKFDEALKEGRVIAPQLPFQTVMIYFPDECRLIRDWRNSEAPVLFDFQKVDGPELPMLWLMLPKISDSVAYITTFSRKLFIDYHNRNEFDEVLNKVFLPFQKELKAVEMRRRRMY